MNTRQMEFAVANHLCWRKHLIVPNVSFGLGFNHELDLAILTKSYYLWEVEIKISKADLKADLKKKHQHKSNKIAKLYFALPEKMKSDVDFIPEHAGIFIVDENSRVNLLREAKKNEYCQKLTEKEVLKLHHLASMRIWKLKQQVAELSARLK